jgi:predicted transposase/invertase (TIGR01784 family)
LREIDEKTKKVSQELLDVPEIAEAIGLAEEAAYSEGELDVYESYWDSVSREKSFISGGFDKGKAEGIAEGRAEEKTKMAINMLKDDEPLDKIIRYTGLSEDDIVKLKD